jgi:hypothetical protein
VGLRLSCHTSCRQVGTGRSSSWELAYLNFEFDVDKPLTKVAVTYAPTTLADGRFGFWTGEVTSDFVSIFPK